MVVIDLEYIENDVGKIIQLILLNKIKGIIINAMEYFYLDCLLNFQ